MVQRFYPCSYCLGQYTSRELILVEVVASGPYRKHWIVCWECLEILDEMEMLDREEPVLADVPVQQ